MNPAEVPGETYYVDSNNGDDTYTGKEWSQALATLDAAVNKCTANNGDTIYVHPAHAESLAADSAVDVDVAGVQIIGLRRGREMPTFNATATAGDFKLAAANVSIRNLRFTGGIDATTGILEVSGADCAIIDCEYRDVTGQATDVLITTAAADRLLIDGWVHFGAAGDGGDTAISLVGSDDCEIRNFWIYGNFDLGAIEFRTTACARVWIHDGLIWTEGAEDLAVSDTITASTGHVGPNVFISLQDNAANITECVGGATLRVFDPVYVVNLDNEKAVLINWTASVDEA
tara:strand:- start:1100 stop:1963 length:864 start_codon:yes stop_codon:yes gene_type:complete